jgi:putative ABC transport system substrate-binding protein
VAYRWFERSVVSRRQVLCSVAAALWTRSSTVLAAVSSGRRGIPVVGVLWHAGSAAEEGKYFVALEEGFRELGYDDGQNIRIEHRFPNEQRELFARYSEELARLNADVLVGVTSQAALALKGTGTQTPIVFLIVPDPVRADLVQSLAHPGGRITGYSNIATDLNAKRLELFKETVPDLKKVAVLVNPGAREIASQTISDLQAAGRALNVTVVSVEASGPVEFDRAFREIDALRVDGIVTAIDPLFFAGRARLAQMALARKLPSIHVNGDAVDAGFLMSFGTNHEAIFRRAPSYVHKILRGASPADLPVEQPTTFEICLNRRTAAAIGLRIPESVLLRAARLVS